MSSENENILDDFIIESREHVDTLEENIMLLEDQADGEPIDADLINLLFRAAHTIKGGAGFLALKNINKLSHQMENLLSDVRDAKIDPDESFIDALLDGIDFLRVMIDSPATSNDEDISAVMEKLKKFDVEAGDQSNKKKSSAKKSNIKKLIDDHGNITELTPDKLRAIEKKYDKYYTIKLNLTVLEKNRNFKPFDVISELQKIGYIIEGNLAVSSFELDEVDGESPLIYNFLIATDQNEEYMKNLFSDEEVNYLCLLKNAEEKTEGNKIPTETPKPDSVATTDILPDQNDNNEQQKEAEVPKKNDDNRKTEGRRKTDRKDEKKSVDQTVRIKVELIDKLMTEVSELILVRNRILLLSQKYDDQELQNSIQNFDSVSSSLQESVMQTRMQPVGSVFNKFPRVVRELGKKLNKKIKLEIKGAEAELDKGLVESLSDPMTHLIRNSCDHGIELPEIREKIGKNGEGTITLNAYHDSGLINIEIKDDGAGIDPEKIAQIALKKELKTAEELERMGDNQKIRLIMLPGFSTKEAVSDLSGRGVGMDVVKSMIDKLGGSFELKSKLNKGTTVLLQLPLTLAIVPSFMIKMGGKIFAIPSVSIEEIVSIEDVKQEIKRDVEWELFQLRDKLIPIVYLKDVLDDVVPFNFEKRNTLLLKHDEDDELYPKNDIQVVILKNGKRSYGLVVDKVIGTEEIVVKPLHALLSNLSCFSGATIMGNGSVSMILNVEGIAAHAGLISYESGILSVKEEKKEVEKLSAVLFANSLKEVFAVTLSKLVRIEKFSSSRIEKIGDREFISFEEETYGIIRLEKYLNLPEMEMKDEMYLFILKNKNKKVGLLVADLIDTIETDANLNNEAYSNEFVIGTKIIDDKLTIFVDIDRVLG